MHRIFCHIRASVHKMEIPGNRNKSPETVSKLAIYQWSTADAYVDNVRAYDEEVIRGTATTAGTTKRFSYPLDDYEVIVFDYKLTSNQDKNGYIAVRLPSSGDVPYYGLFHLYANGGNYDGVWQRSTVESILRNEKYKGAALLQKKFTVDFLQKKMKVNEGEVPQYYVEHSHEAIIAPEEWERVQLELARRRHSPRRTVCSSPFAGKIVCGDCGEIFGSKVWHSNSKYRRTIWRCNAKYESGDTCNTPHLYEDDLKQHFITALSQLLTDRTALLEDNKLILNELLDTAALDTECDRLLQELEVVAGMIQQMINENATKAADQAAYAERYNSLVDRYEKLQAKYDALQQQKERRQIQAEAIENCMEALEELDLLEITFTDALWNTVVDHVTVHADKRLVFHCKNGSEVEVSICK